MLLSLSLSLSLCSNLNSLIISGKNGHPASTNRFLETSVPENFEIIGEKCCH
jgi:hypothetical protein